jgi:hypothetical protein
VTFNLYCCRERAEWNWLPELAEAFGAKDVSVRALARGLLDPH